MEGLPIAVEPDRITEVGGVHVGWVRGVVAAALDR